MIKQLAEESTKLLVTDEFSKFADSTHPKVVALLGGKNKMIAIPEKGMQEMKSEVTITRAPQICESVLRQHNLGSADVMITATLSQSPPPANPDQ